MKNVYSKPSFTDTFTSAALIAAMLMLSLTALVTSFDARAEQVTVAAPTVTLETIVVTAPRITVEKLETIVVVASRN
jgi:hypothetical protein